MEAKPRKVAEIAQAIAAGMEKAGVSRSHYGFKNGKLSYLLGHAAGVAVGVKQVVIPLHLTDQEIEIRCRGIAKEIERRNARGPV